MTLFCVLHLSLETLSTVRETAVWQPLYVMDVLERGNEQAGSVPLGH